jgi:hypothetical protein
VIKEKERKKKGGRGEEYTKSDREIVVPTQRVLNDL